MALLKNTSINDTGFLKLPNGTTAQRPVSPSTGMIRYNTDLSLLEYWNGAEWKTCEDSLLDGSSAEKAAPSALYLINFAGKFENGYYWILVGGVPKLVYCDLANGNPSTGGWMYLIPPSNATDINPFGLSFTNTASQPNCATDSAYQTSTNWGVYYSYRCGSSDLTTTYSWNNNMSTTQVRFAAVIGGGSTRQLTLNGSAISSSRSSSANFYWSDSSSTCSSNTCWSSSTHWNSATPRTFNSSGNLTISLYAAFACQPDCYWGVSNGISQLAIR